MRFRTALILGALAVGLFVMPASSALSQAATKTYVVQMLANPVVAYNGGVPGLEATKPAKGQKIDPQSSKVRRYVEHLNGTHANALQKVGGGQKIYDYVYSFNGPHSLFIDTMRTLRNIAEYMTGMRGRRSRAGHSC
jgi:hypothetical protein